MPSEPSSLPPSKCCHMLGSLLQCICSKSSAKDSRKNRLQDFGPPSLFYLTLQSPPHRVDSIASSPQSKLKASPPGKTQASGELSQVSCLPHRRGPSTHSAPRASPMSVFLISLFVDQSSWDSSYSVCTFCGFSKFCLFL